MEDYKKYIKWGTLALIILVILILNPWTTIGAGERGVVTKFGQVEERILQSGLHFITPFVESVHKIDVQIQKEQVKVSSASKDLQTVNALVALNYNLNPSKVNELYQQVGMEYGTRVIDPAIQEALKAATAQFTAEELITKRPLVKEQVLVVLRQRLATNNILVDDFSIIDFDFSQSFNEAIEKKVTAEQNALAAKNKLEQVKFEAEQRIAQARAEAEAIRSQSEAANNEKYVSLKRVEVLKQFAEKWDGKLPVNIYGSTPLPLLNLTQ